MAREILPESTISQTSTVPDQSLARVTVSDPPMAPFGDDNRRDALAGAFPEWDLLPAVPFVRRVK